MSSEKYLSSHEWETILTFASIKDLISCMRSAKCFAFITGSELLAKHWLNLLSFSYLATRAMTVFYHTNIFRIFARTISYKMDNLQKKCVSINIYSQKNRKYLKLFKYSCASISLSPESESGLFRKCTFTDNDTKVITTLKRGEMSIVNKNKFLEDMNKYFHFDKWRFYINWELYNIAGGSLLKCISTNSFISSKKQDIDLFYAFKNETLKQKNISNKTYAHLFMDKMVNNGYQVIYTEHVYADSNCNIINIVVNFKCNASEIGKLSLYEFIKRFQSHLIHPSKYSFSYQFSDPGVESVLVDNKWVKFQFISVLDVTKDTDKAGHFVEHQYKDCTIKTIDHDNIISNFDIDICQIRFDGNDIFCTCAFIFAISCMTCISYKLPLRENFSDNVDWRAFYRAIKYNNRGYELLVPIDFNLDPLCTAAYHKWYTKYKNIVHPNIGYSSRKNHDFMAVLARVKALVRDGPVECVTPHDTNPLTPGDNSNDTVGRARYNQHKLDLCKIRDDILQHGIFDNSDQVYMNYFMRTYDIDPRYILVATDTFCWLYGMIRSSHIITNFEWSQSYISNQKFKNRRWDLLVFESMLFVQCFYYPSTLKLVVQNVHLFRRFMIIFHWIFDYWFHITRFKPSKKVRMLPEISKFIFKRLTSIQAVYCRFLKQNHLIMYVDNKKIFKRYVLDVLQFEMKYNEDASQNRFKLTRKKISNLRIFTNEYHQIKPSFRILAIKLLCLYCNNDEEIQQLNQFVSFGYMFIEEPDFPHLDIYDEEYNKAWDKYKLQCRLNTRYITNLNKRMDHALNDMYNKVYCEYTGCNINYYQHLYGLDYSLLSDVHNGVKFDKKYRIDGKKWFKCKGCKVIYYCCRKCQKKDWKDHKSNCFC